MVMSNYTKQRVINLYLQGETVSSIVDRLVLKDGIQGSKQGVRNLLKRYVRYRTICDRICKKGSYTCIRFSNFKEAELFW